MNIGWELSGVAERTPNAMAVVEPAGRNADGTRKYNSISFRELDEDSSRIAAGLHDYGVKPGMRLALLVKPGIDFVSLVFALFKAGVVTILIDPGMGRDNLVRCLEEAEPEGFVAIPLAQAVRVVKRSRFPKAKFNVTVGRRWFWGGTTLAKLRGTSRMLDEIQSDDQDPAAIIFTTGSTGPPKGVLYRHGNFANQVSQIRDRYEIQPGEVDLPGFPLFGLFNSAMGVTTVFPEMDFTRPADVNPKYILEHVADWSPSQSFGSPALWNTVGKHCEKTGESFRSIKRVLSAGAPVPPHVLARVKAAIAEDGEIHTPYGATEALLVASISATEVLGETAERSAQGAGTCAGRRFDGITWRVIRISDAPIESIEDAVELPRSDTGELIVQGPVVTTEYVTRPDANAIAKIRDGEKFWHRMGDCGYLDEQDRFWFCGRKSHRVKVAAGTMFTVPCEAIANGHPKVYRSALVGIGDHAEKTPVMIVELWPEHKSLDTAAANKLLDEVHERLASSWLTDTIERRHVLLHPSFPVDIRHNAKIFREKLAPWAKEQILADGR